MGKNEKRIINLHMIYIDISFLDNIRIPGEIPGKQIIKCCNTKYYSKIYKSWIFFSFREFITFINTPEESAWKGFVLAAGLYFATTTKSLLCQQWIHRIVMVGINARAAIVAAIYKKVGSFKTILFHLRPFTLVLPNLPSKY